MQTLLESHNESDTMKIARAIGEESQPGEVICLSGQPGAGKTRFVKGYAGAFGIDPDEVTSPTFTLVHEYSGRVPVYHFDCYRIENVEEALEIGAEEYFYGDGVCIIEWPDRISAILPERCIRISMEVTGPESRKIIINRNRQAKSIP